MRFLRQAVSTRNRKWKTDELEKRVIDFEKVEQEVGSLQGYDYMFSCFGTTRANAGSAVGVVGVPERTGGVHAH